MGTFIADNLSNDDGVDDDDGVVDDDGGLDDDDGVDDVCENDDDGIIAFAASQNPPRVVTGCDQVANGPRNPCSKSPQVLDLCCKACTEAAANSNLRGGSGDWWM